MPGSYTLFDRIHSGYIQHRRVNVLAGHFSRLIPQEARLLDIGSGDGQLAGALLETRSDLRVTGVDIKVRANTGIPVQAFDGKHLPFSDHSFDWAILADVIHHMDEPEVLLTDALRVVKQGLLIKDHLKQGWLAGPLLTFMDEVGNKRYAVDIPCNYWPPETWQSVFTSLNLEPDHWQEKLGLYPFPLNLLFERKMHFIARMRKKAK